MRVGREPFDVAARQALEQQNPDLEFDWSQILATPIPSAEAERWRERRRQERAARQFAAEEDSATQLDDLEVKQAFSDVDRPDENLDIASVPVVPADERPRQPNDVSRRRRRRRRGRWGRQDAAHVGSGEDSSDFSETPAVAQSVDAADRPADTDRKRE